ncbi:flagellar hook-length control protein FliK [Chitiniphilus eburneus]|uniref:Flagellar hook-length control protein FliK n=1 Tax=Chitiniphilus eburneus TaxID=2571148 RepID=A0A4U0PZI8_9NEIS|nr:flagellar hook-length control protein FliK [Chitiniphilus eburneus]TJZ74035.1 flagellar hook-length control protein FliK [Chitiniphilus eburneus]
MLPGNPAASVLQLYVRTQQGLVEVLKPSPDEAARYTPGERVHATVVEQMPNGRFAVLVKDQLLDLNLPRNTQPGEEFDLTVVARDPKLTFAMAQTQTAAPQTREAALSQAARYLTTLLTGSRGDAGKATVTLQGNEPLFNGKPDASQLASRLSGVLSESGLFYESHQAEWVNGQRSLQALLREPQAQLPRSVPDPQNAQQTTGKGHNAEELAQMRNSSPSLDRMLNAHDQRLGVEAQALLKGLVQQQLDAIEQRPVIWQGQAWPGQPLKWQLELENQRDADGHVDTEAQRWQTRLDLDLPNLGGVSIIATLYEGQFNLQFSAERPDTVARLRDHQSQLGRQFDAAGLTLGVTQFEVGQEAAADGA